MKPILLFAGPSLVRSHLPIDRSIELLPPARCGDLLRAMHLGPAAIALVDGVFETAPTVWHKEILAVLDRGIAVYGAASLGALRAAELDRYGMIGIGVIYQAYRDGTIESDAAVMVAHAPAELGHRALTLALVDAEASLLAARLDPADRAMLLSIARRSGFRARTWATILAEFAARVGDARSARVSALIAAAAFSQKERDTATLIDCLLAGRCAPQRRCAVPRTIFLDRLLNACSA